jgi:predicted nucleotidyltransferase
MRTVNQLPLAPRDRKAIEQAASELRKRLPIEELRLFGSKARGTDEAESDIDLLVLTSRPLSWRERGEMTDTLFNLELVHDVLFNVLALPAREWTEGPYIVLPIHDEIDRDGVLV